MLFAGAWVVKGVAVATGDASDVLTREQVAAWLQIRPRQVERFGIPRLALGRKTVRYLRGDVAAWLKQQRKAS